MIADESELLRIGLAAFIQQQADFQRVGEASSGRQAIDLCGVLHPDVVIIDVLMPVVDGITATRVIRQRYHETQVVVLTNEISEDLVTGVLNAGAISYLLKNVSLEALAAAIRDAVKGKATLAREAAQFLVQATQRGQPPNYDLTGRELEVLTLMIHGINNQQIARELRVSLSTIKKHVSSILVKLKTSSRTEAVAIAVRHKLVNEELLESASRAALQELAE